MTEPASQTSRLQRTPLSAAAPTGLLVAYLGLGVLSVFHRAGTGSAPPAPHVQPPRAPPSATVVAVGDVMLDRGPGGKIRRGGPQVIFQRVLPLLEDGDVRFCNLECPLSTTGPHDPMNMVFRARPAAVEALVHGGFDVVSLANNHALDAGSRGLQATIAALRTKGIRHAGAHGSSETEPPWATFSVQGLRIGFLAYSQFKPSQALLSQDTLQSVCDQARRAADVHDLLFVSVHWGVEYRRTPGERQVTFAHALAEAGADVILGHHPHVLQGVEVYKGTAICYSLGNFVFDQRDVEAMESAVFRFRCRPGTGLELRVTPVWIPRATFAPESCQRDKADQILRRLHRLCSGLGTELRIIGDRAVTTVYHTAWQGAAGPAGAVD